MIITWQPNGKSQPQQQNNPSSSGGVINWQPGNRNGLIKQYTLQNKFKQTQVQKPQPNFFQKAEQGVSNFFGGLKNDLMPNNPAIKVSPNSLPSGLKLNFVTPSKNANTTLNIEGQQPKQKPIKLVGNNKIAIQAPPKIVKQDSSSLIDPFNTGVTAVDLAPSTIKTLADLQIDPFSLKKAPKATLLDLFKPFGNPITNNISNNYIKGIVDSVKADEEAIKAVFTAKSNSERVGAGAQAAARTVGVFLSPLTSLFSAANDIPVLGSVSRLISLPFDALGDAGRDLAYPIANMLPISKKAKENIVGGIGEINSLALMLIAGGKIADIPKKISDSLIKKYGKTDAATIMETAKSLADEKARLKRIGQQKDAQYQQFEASKDSGKPLQLQSGKSSNPLLLEAKNPQSQVQGEGFVMSDTPNKRNIELLKAQQAYHGALRDYNRRPTPEKLTKVQQLRDKFYSLRDSSSPETPKTAKELIKPGEYTPKEVRKIVLNSPLKGTPEGNQIITHSIQAENQGKNVQISQADNVSEVKPSESQPNTGNATSSVGKTIEAKAIEDKLTKGFENVAGYDKSTFKEQAQKAADLINSGIDNVRAVLRGEKPLPEGLRTSSLLGAMQKYIEDNPSKDNATILQEMANSPLIGENISKGAQEVSFSRMIEQDSATAKLADIKKSRIDKVGGLDKVDKTKSTLKSDIKKVNLSKEDLSWSNFLDSIKC